MPQGSSTPAAFDAAVASLSLHGDNASELARWMVSDDPSDSDLIFSLYGAAPKPAEAGAKTKGAKAAAAASPPPPVYLGEAFVNLQEMLRGKGDVQPSAPLTLIGADEATNEDVEIGEVSVRVTAVAALEQVLASLGVSAADQKGGAAAGGGSFDRSRDATPRGARGPSGSRDRSRDATPRGVRVPKGAR